MKSPSAFAVAAIIAALLATSLVTQGQQASPVADPELEHLAGRVKSFLDRLNYDVSGAYRDLLSSNPLAKETDSLSALEQKTHALRDRYGDFRYAEQVAVRRVGKDVVTFKYLYHCDTFPVVWHVTFYRTYKRNETPRDENWQVISVRFDTNVENLAL
jgi:hypothetical protein